MRRLGVIAFGLLLALAAASPAHAAPKRTRYVAHDFHFIVTAIAAQATGVALQGEIGFVARHERERIRIDDDVVNGTVPVVYGVEREGAQFRCLPTDHAAELSGLRPGARVWLYVLDTTYRGECRTGATTGRITLLR